MVLCLGGTLNHVTTLRELEAVLRVAHAALNDGQLFVFDLRTILGLAAEGQSDMVASDGGDGHFIVGRSAFNHDTSALTTTYTIFHNTRGWARADEVHVLRGYPVQGVTRLLSQIGLKLIRTLDTDLRDAEDRKDLRQLIFVARCEPV
jgi:hypothetical protein